MTDPKPCRHDLLNCFECDYTIDDPLPPSLRQGPVTGLIVAGVSVDLWPRHSRVRDHRVASRGQEVEEEERAMSEVKPVDFDHMRTLTERECTCGGRGGDHPEACNACQMYHGFNAAEARIESDRAIIGDLLAALEHQRFRGHPFSEGCDGCARYTLSKARAEGK
jgi:hypothetical protein